MKSDTWPPQEAVDEMRKMLGERLDWVVEKSKGLESDPRTPIILRGVEFLRDPLNYYAVYAVMPTLLQGRLQAIVPFLESCGVNLAVDALVDEEDDGVVH